jgi:TatD DNase family protein
MAALDMGLAIAFGGLVFRHGEEASAEVARLVPRDRLLIETDAPYLAPPGVPRNSVTAAPPSGTGTVAPASATDVTGGFRGRRNSPQWVHITAEWLAERRGETPDSIGQGLVPAYDATFRRQSTV